MLMLILAVTLSAEATKFRAVFGSEDFTGLVKKNLPEDLPSTIHLRPGGYWVVSQNNMRDGEAKPDSMGQLVARLDDNGKLESWHQVSVRSDLARIATATADGGILFAGSRSGGSTGLGEDGILLKKLGPDGVLQWETSEKTPELCDGSRCGRQAGDPFELVERSDGGFCVHFRYDIGAQLDTVDAVLRYSAAGKRERVTILSERVNAGFPAAMLPDCSIWSAAAEGTSLEVRRYDPQGKRLFSKRHEAVGDKVIPYAAATRDGGLVISAWVPEPAAGKPNKQVLRLDAQGERLWSYSDAEPMPGCAYPVETRNGGVVVALGVSEDHPATLLYIDPQGAVGWRTQVGAKKATVANDLIATLDGGVAMVGYTKDFGAWYIDVLVAKTDAKGDAGPAVPRGGTPVAKTTKKSKGKKPKP